MFSHTYTGFKGRAVAMTGVYVSPEYRRQGIASEFVKHIATVSSF